MGPPEDVTAAWPILCEGSAERLDASGSLVVDSASSTEVPRSLSSPAATTRNLHRCFLGGMGAFSANLTLSGIWSPVLRRSHINVLEMHAVMNTITLKGAFLCNSVVQVSSDNLSVVYYINKQGGTRSPPLMDAVSRCFVLPNGSN